MISILPIEVIENVVTNLSNNDKLVCLFTCRLWYSHLYHVILQKVTIHHRREFKSFLSLLQNSEGHNMGNYVRELYLKKGVGTTCEEFSIVAKCCPLLEIFKFSNWRYYKCNSFLPLSYLKQIPKLQDLKKGLSALKETSCSLTHLEVGKSIVEELVIADRLLPFLKIGSNLTHLTLEGVYRVDIPRARSLGTKFLEFNYLTWQAIHTACPHLVSISMDNPVLTATPRGAEIMYASSDQEIIQVYRLKELKLNSLHLENPAWLSYLARKYPNLKGLHLDFFLGTFINRRDRTTERLGSASCQAEFIRMASRLEDLRSLTLTGLRESHFLGSVFFKILNSHNLEHATIEYEKGASTPGFDLNMLETLVHKREDALQSIDMGMWVGSHLHFDKLLKPLSLCKRLKKLSLTSDDYEGCLYNPIPLDLILDECARLTDLSFYRSTLAIEDKHSVKRIHPLEKLSVVFTKVAQPIFEYLSVRCPNLNTMKVDSCIWMPREVEMIINMPYTQFDSLQIAGLNLYYFPRLEGNLGGGRSVNLFSVTQLDSIEKKKERYTRRIIDYDEDPEEDLSSWYHVYLWSIHDTTHSPKKCIRRLYEQEVIVLKKLAQYFYQNHHRVRMTREEDLYTNETLLKKEWTYDVQHGFVSIVCKSLRTLEYDKCPITWST